MKTIHVLPVNDIKEHIQNETCVCKPDVIILDNATHKGRIVVHHAFDCRELFEFNQQLNN